MRSLSGEAVVVGRSQPSVLMTCSSRGLRRGLASGLAWRLGLERSRGQELHVVGIDADAPLGRTLGERRLDPGTARLVLDYHERVGLARLLIEHVKTGDEPGNGLDRVAQVLDVGVLWVGWLGVESGQACEHLSLLGMLGEFLTVLL